MADLPEEATYEAGIYQLELTDPVEAGPDGIDNLQAKQLANRTKYLKAQLDSGKVIPAVAGTAAAGPTAAAVEADRRRVVMVEGAAGEPDSLWLAMKRANDTYAWVQIG